MKIKSQMNGKMIFIAQKLTMMQYFGIVDGYCTSVSAAFTNYF